MITPDETPCGESLMIQSEFMADDALIRLENLRATNLTARELSTRVGGRVTYWHDMLAGNKSFGEKIARKIEEALGMARGDLDKPIIAKPLTTGEAHGLEIAPVTASEAVAGYPAKAAALQPSPCNQSRMAMDLAIEFDLMQAPEHEKRLIHAHCMLLINRNPLLLRQLGIATPATDGEPPTTAPRHSPQKSSW